MKDILLQEARASDFPVIASWIVQMCQVPAQQCLHSWAGEDPDVLCAQLLKTWQDSELLYWIARYGNKILGVMGGEYDESLGRAWLHGPNVSPEAWERAAPLLYEQVAGNLPRGITQMEAYLNAENQRGVRFYTTRGFTENGYACEYALAVSERVTETSQECMPLQAQHQEPFVRLYETIFPAGYYSGERIVSMIGHSHQVYTRIEAGELRGFVVTCVEIRGTKGEIQFLGVQEGWRGRGYGKSLLLAGVDALISQAGITEITLNVHEEEAQPRRLYESVGFRLRYRGIALRKTLREREQ